MMAIVPSRRSGFSLVELMIAIMILGLGMVMVATVFPVSLDLTRGTLQLNIADAAFETATTTLQLRLPSRFTSFEPSPANSTAEVVLVPDVRAIELNPSAPAVIDEPDYHVDSAGLEVGQPGARVAFSDVFGTLPVATLFSTHWPTYKTLFPDRSRAYTEQTYWDCEVNDFLVSGNWVRNTWVVPSMNIAVGGGWVYESTPATLDATGQYLYLPTSLPYIQYPDYIAPPALNAGPLPRPPRIHLADRVYPPVSLEAAPDGTYLGWNSLTQQHEVFANAAAMNAYVTSLARDKRYAWTAFASQGGTSLQEFRDSKRTFLCTLALTYRGDLSARYAHQQLPPDGQFNFSDKTDSDYAGDVDMMRRPVPDKTTGPATDTLFPQPWLVMLANVNPKAGTITCSAYAARLLPANSYLIVAQSTGGLQAGAPIKITDAPSPIVLNAANPYTLQIARTDGSSASDVAVWVFPPAINPDRQTFQRSSPVVAVSVREVTPDWGK